MKNHNHSWTDSQIEEVRTLWKQGLSDDQIGAKMGRTAYSIQTQRSKHGMKTFERRLEPSAKFTRYLKPSTEVSIFWGLIKFKKG